MDKIGYLIDEIRKEQEEYVHLQHTMINQIHGLEDKIYEQILVDRFIQGMSVKQICSRYNYSKMTGYRLFRKALDTFAYKYDTN
jgi:DNA-directed RNA polymerase specialized sigma subunit